MWKEMCRLIARQIDEVTCTVPYKNDLGLHTGEFIDDSDPPPQCLPISRIWFLIREIMADDSNYPSKS